MSVSRRTILGAGASGLAASTFGFPNLLSADERIRGRAKNIIFCVADGMAASVPTMVDHLHQLNHGEPSYWTWLTRQDFVVNGLQDTRSLNSIVTDSSAASSSWGCGRHIWNGQVNEYPDGTKLRTLQNLMREAGLRTGLVTTCTITHATPAGFAVNCKQRDLEAMIAERYLAAEVDVLMGGGDRFFSPTSRGDKRDLYGDFERKGYTVVKDRDSLVKSRSEKLLGIFSSSHLPYTVDRDNSLELRRNVPTLAEMSQKAIEALQGRGKGFLLQIEGGKVDHGAHASDLAAMLYDQMAFEDAVKVAVDFALKDKNTLVVITADHATGGPALNGAGAEYIDSTAGLLTVNGMKSSYGDVFAAIGKPATAPKVQEAVEAKLGIQMKAEHAQVVADAINGKSPFASSMFYGSSGQALAMMLGNYTKVTWTSGNHTSDHVRVTALGPGRENFRGVTQNIRIFDILLAQHGLKWSNPTQTFEQARADYAKLRAQIDPELVAQYGHPEDAGLWA